MPRDPVTATVTAVRFDPFSRQVWTSHRSGAMFVLNNKLRVVDSLFNLESPFSDFQVPGGH